MRLSQDTYCFLEKVPVVLLSKYVFTGNHEFLIFHVVGGLREGTEITLLATEGNIPCTCGCQCLLHVSGRVPIR